jgi:archaellum component FlaC
MGGDIEAAHKFKVMQITPLEKKRIQNINFIMDDLHSSINNIYELLMDKEYSLLSSEVTIFMRKLKSINESVQDES